MTNPKKTDTEPPATLNIFSKGSNPTSTKLKNRESTTEISNPETHVQTSTFDKENRISISDNLKEKLNRATLKAQLHFWRRKPDELMPVFKQDPLFPYLGSIMVIPSKMLSREEDCILTPILLEALKIKITDSSHEQTHEANKTDSYIFRVELVYGNVKWVVNRRLYDFIKLHSVLKLKNYAGKAPKTPKFPDIVSYAFQRAKMNDDDKLAKLAKERREALENYTNKVLKRYNLRTSNELCQFLEFSNLSFSKDMGWKGKEGYIEVKFKQKSMLACCYPFIRSKWMNNWIIIRDSYVAFCTKTEDTVYSDVYLYTNNTKIEQVDQINVNPLKSYTLSLVDSTTMIELRSDNDDLISDWKAELQFSLEKNPYTQRYRFNSFAPLRNNVACSWYVDGADYFYELSEAILNAEHTIYILDWWLSPEIYLRRPPHLHEKFRLDRLLKYKAEQGINIYIIVYKEVTISLTIDSSHTKISLKKLHPLIKVQRHPDHVQNATLFWAHHEKLVVIDKKKVFMGGLDLCFGRFDNNAHVLADYNPSVNHLKIWPGQDYSNPRMSDFVEVKKYYLDSIDRQTFPRMGWHDIALQTSGKIAKDLSRHFVQRWNFIKNVKARNRSRIPYLIPTGEESYDREEEKGTCRIQVMRSSAEWSSGIKKERSIYNAYIKLILEANHFIYIENQFFVSLARDDPNYKVKNQIAKALVDRIKQAHDENKKFKVVIILPLLPAFANELDAGNAYTIRLIMHYQYFSMSRGDNSIMQQLKKSGIDGNQYISFYGLRNYDLIPESHTKDDNYNQSINTDLLNIPKKGPAVDFSRDNMYKAKASSLYEVNDNSSDDSDNEDDKSNHRNSNLFTSLKPKKNLRYENGFPFSKPTTSMLDFRTLPSNKKPTDNPLIKYSRKESLLRQNSHGTHLKRLENSSTNKLNNNPSVCDGTKKEDEKMQYVTEEIYVHSKLMIVDDLKVILGSANINDRSMVGSRDSEIALCIEDMDLIDSTMDNNPCKVSRYAHSLRKNLCMEHLGLLPGTNMEKIIKNMLNHHTETDDQNKDFIQEIKILSEKHKNEKYEEMVKDPLSSQFINLWTETSKNNTFIFREVFQCVPDDTVTNWNVYKEFVTQTKTPYSHPTNKDKVTQLARIKGHLVEFPLKFLEEEDLDSSSFRAESFAPDEIFT